MAISTYTELQTAVDAWLGHGLFTAHVPEFIRMFEASANRRLRARQMITDQDLTTDEGVVALGDLDEDDGAARYLQWISLHRNSTTTEALEYASFDWLALAFPTSPQGIAKFWTLEDNIIRVYPLQDDTFRLTYYRTIPGFTVGDTTESNWLLEDHPDLYLFGALCEAELFGVNDNRAALWKARRDEIYEEIQRLSNRSRGPGTVRVMSGTP